MMNEIPEGYEIVEVRTSSDLKIGDRVGSLGELTDVLPGRYAFELNVGARWDIEGHYLTAILAAANYRVLRKKKPPEPVVIECEIDVPYLIFDTIESPQLWRILRDHIGKRFNAVLTEIQEPA